MDLGNRQLIGINVFEDVDESVDPVLRRAIGFAGRLLVDAGANVSVRPNANLSETSELACFLDDGKSQGSAVDGAFVLTTHALGEWEGVRITAYPSGSTENSLPISDLIFQAQSGICHLMGDPEREPLKLGGHQASYTAGYAIFSAIVTLALQKTRFGTTAQAEVDVYSTCAWVNWKAVAFGALNHEIKREGKQAEWPVFPTQDGHAAMVFFEPHWPKIVDLLVDPVLKDEKLKTFEGRRKYRELYTPSIKKWFASRSGEEIAEIMDREGIPNGVIATPTSILTDPLVEHRGGLAELVIEENKVAKRPLPPVRISQFRPTDSEARWLNSQTFENRPLEGVRVLDFGIITAGAGAGAVLSDLGADVIKIESPTYPDPFRDWAGSDKGDSPLFKFNNRGKRGLAIDLKEPKGLQAFKTLVSESDIVIENFRRGVIDRLGIGFSELSKLNPNILLVSLTSQGLDGPGSNNSSFGSSLEARSGMASITGYPGEVPIVSGRNLNYPDQIVCLHGASVIVAALLEQISRPGARHIDVSQRDIAQYTLGEQIVEASLGKNDHAPVGNNDSSFAFQGMLQTVDGDWVAVSALQTPLNEALSSFDLCQQSELSEWAQKRTSDEIVSSLQRFGIACTKSLSGLEVFASQLIESSKAFVKAPSGEMVKGFPFYLKHSPQSVTLDSPSLGEHNEEILSNV